MAESSLHIVQPQAQELQHPQQLQTKPRRRVNRDGVIKTQTPSVVFGLHAQAGAATSTGKKRTLNEDAYFMGKRLFIVCDGLGGHDAGEIAAGMAIQVLSDAEEDLKSQTDVALRVKEIAQMILAAPKHNLGREGMATTLTCALLLDNEVLVTQIGDSRAYLLRANRFKRVTTDHSLVQEWLQEGEITETEMKTHAKRSVITRALGTEPFLAPDYFEVIIKPGDRMLLCTDGLHGLVDDREIKAILAAAKTPQTAATKLVSAANYAGGTDNTTVVVIDFVKGI